MSSTDLLSMTQAEASLLERVLRKMRGDKQPTVMDIHHPERSEGWPRYEHQPFPKMVYHPIKLDPAIETQRANIRLRNQRNPNLPALDLPHSRPLSLKVLDAQALSAAEREGFVLKPPMLCTEEETAALGRDPLAESVADLSEAQPERVGKKR